MKVRTIKSEKGASLIEYSLLVALISGVAIGALGFFGQAAQNSIQTASCSLGGPNPAGGGTSGTGGCVEPNYFIIDDIVARGK